MPLPWVRLDSNIATHDKILALLSSRDGARAFVLYVCALGYAGGQATDGHIPTYALAANHGNPRLAQMLIDHKLWEYNGDGSYVIHNWEERQELAIVTEAKRAAKRAAARKGNCIKYHGPKCGCWQRNSEA